ncbi:3-dehydroquinate synthase [Romeria aff. gracilis LEGE 07310]|uniref:3-dehydroquinate synthase n=1 Tax=Vasconcelosia minhoensis LEGE 07310 TaxID=915328 RepID=A0A8J7AN23_9CYAN|nr:3-dehydroquinate synthase [Romeria gracilis]MBE9077529.1 3-dehydroquinate synthase [Romeria aff. gracilis LEGE 07310]
MIALSDRSQPTSPFGFAPIRQQFLVPFRYDVHFTDGLLQPDNPLLAQVVSEQRRPSRVMVVVDSGLLAHSEPLEQIGSYARRYAAQMTLVAPPLVVPAGEAAKNDPTLVEQLCQAIDAGRLCRHSYVVAIGGGAVLDLVGYAAATAHRGIRLIRVPTTVLAQNDSGVGVKNGINAFGKKNFLGTFAPPFAVLNDFSFLTTLSDRDWRAGIAEAVKVALIKDADFFNQIEQSATALASRNVIAMQRLVYSCAQLHLDHIAYHGDPFELGSSRPLDFGHWAAHRLEHLTQYRLRHGEAVAIGIALDTLYSQLIGRLSRQDCQRVLATLQKLGFTLFVPELSLYLDQPEHPQSLFKGLQEFQEHLGGELTIMLLTAIGQGVEVHEVDLDYYRAAISLLTAPSQSSVSDGLSAYSP